MTQSYVTDYHMCVTYAIDMCAYRQSMAQYARKRGDTEQAQPEDRIQDHGRKRSWKKTLRMRKTTHVDVAPGLHLLKVFHACGSLDQGQGGHHEGQACCGGREDLHGVLRKKIYAGRVARKLTVDRGDGQRRHQSPKTRTTINRKNDAVVVQRAVRWRALI